MRSIPLPLGVCALLLSLVLGGCADDPVAGPQRTLVIGVGEGEPGFSDIDGDEPELVGFDIDVARYVARALGWAQQEIEYRPIPRSTRAQALRSGEVDMVVSTFRITPETERVVDFAGPYLVGRQDLLVRSDNATITGPSSLDGRILCAVTGSPDARVLQEPRFSPDVRLRPAASLSECVDDLLAGDVDAVTSDDVVLAGYVAENPDDIKVVDSPFDVHHYGVGLPQGSPDVAVVDDVLREMIEVGIWRSSYLRYLREPGTTVPTPPVPGSR